MQFVSKMVANYHRTALKRLKVSVTDILASW